MLLTADRQIKIMDFGISHISTSHLTQVGSVLGTPRYMSPEQFRGDPVDARSDLFSTGAVLHELLTGRPPIAGRSFEEVMVKLLHDGIELTPPDPLMPEPMRNLVARALALKADDRFEDAHAMATALRRALAEVEARGGAVPQAEARTVYRPAASPDAHGEGQGAASLPDRPAPITPMPPAAPTGAGPGADPGLADSEVLGTIERRLAQHIGPMAGRLLRNALKGADSVESLCQSLAQTIEADAERESFLRDVHRQLQGTAVISHAGRTGQRLFSPAATALSAEEIDRVQQDLTRYLGPFARILVKRAAPQATSVMDLRQRLAGHVDKPAERDAFLAGR